MLTFVFLCILPCVFITLFLCDVHFIWCDLQRAADADHWPCSVTENKNDRLNKFTGLRFVMRRRDSCKKTVKEIQHNETEGQHHAV